MTGLDIAVLAFVLATCAAVAVTVLWLGARREASLQRESAAAVRSQLIQRDALRDKLRLYEAIEPEPAGYEARLVAASAHMRQLRDEFENEVQAQRVAHATQVADAQQQVRDAHERVLTMETKLSTLHVALAAADALLEDREPVVYPRQYPLESSEQLKARLKSIQGRQAEIRKRGQVVTRFGPAVQERMSSEERAKTKSLVRLARLALEAAVDSLVEKVKATNQERLEVQFQLVVTDLNRTLSPWGFEIGKNYQATVYESLDVKTEYLQQVEKEREEQRALREQMREEAAAQREAERAQKQAEDEERRAERELARAAEAASRASEEERERWLLRVQELEAALSAAHSAKERAVAMAQLTKAGHIYVISNLGSFGRDVFKVGMTRRLDPEDRILELGDASVPFPFDIHGMIKSDDAPALESALHRALDGHRVNRVNLRKEFFRIPFTELQQIVVQHGARVEMTELAEAIEFRQTRAMLSGTPAPNHEHGAAEVGAEEPGEVE